jgi:formyl-CoA transferase
VLDSGDVLGDEHLKQRDMVVTLEHPVRGAIPYPGNPIKMTNWPATKIEAAPSLGRDNDEVYARLLGLSGEEIARLRCDGVI